MLKSICNVACQRLAEGGGGEGHLAGPGSETSFVVRARIKLAATKLITFGYFQLVAAQLSSRKKGLEWAWQVAVCMLGQKGGSTSAGCF